MNRREALGSLAFFAEFLALTGNARAQAPAGAPAAAPRPPVFVHDLPNVNMDGWQVTVSEVLYPPGRVGTPHKHAGFVLAYVLEGEIITKISDQGPEKNYKVGDMFYEQPGATHEVSKNASATVPARLLAMILAPKGATLTTQV